jgi:hypothetical protein
MAKSKTPPPSPPPAPTAPSPTSYATTDKPGAAFSTARTDAHSYPSVTHSEVSALRARIAELEAFNRNSSTHGLNHTAAAELLKKSV